VSEMLGEELGPGLWSWSAFRPEWKDDVVSAAVVESDSIVLVDPQVEDGQWDQLEQAIGRRQVNLLFTLHFHSRSAPAIVERWPATRVWAHAHGKAALNRRVAVTDVYRPGDELPGGFIGLSARPNTEILLWRPESATLIVGDSLLGDGYMGEGLKVPPPAWLARTVTPADVREAYRPILDLQVEILLLSHGKSIHAGAAKQLAAAIA
jgi:hypothetical protein